MISKVLKAVLCLSLLAWLPAYSQTTPSSYEDLLNLSLDELMELDVVTTSKISTENIAEVPSVISVVTADDIKRSGARNMEEVLRSVAGLDVIRSGMNPNTNVGVRGLYSTDGTNNKILFLINGHPFRSVFYGDAGVFLGNYPVNDIEQVEIIRGPGSTLFGAGAFLAVINIKTKSAARNAEVSVSSGSFNTQEIYGLASVKKSDEYSLSLSGNYYRTDGPELMLNSDLAGEIMQPFADMFNHTAPISAAPGFLNYGRNTLNLNLNSTYKNFYLTGAYMRSEDQPLVGVIEALAPDNKYKNMGSFAELGYRLPLAKDRGELLVKTYYDHFQMDQQAEYWSKETTQLFNAFTRFSYMMNPGLTDEAGMYREDEGQFYRTMAHHNSYGAEMNLAYNFSNKVKILSGLMYETVGQGNVKTYANGNIFFAGENMVYDNNIYIPLEAFGTTRDISDQYNWNQAADRQIYALFGQAEINLIKLLGIGRGLTNLSLVAGGRYDAYSDAGSAFNPRAALLVSPSEQLYFKALYGQAFRAPSFAELYLQNSSIIMGNPDLMAELVKTSEAVLGYKPNKRSDITLSYFNTTIFNNIQLINNPVTNTTTYENIGTYRTAGLETDLRYTFREAAYVWGTFTYQHAENITNETVKGITEEGEVLEFQQDNFKPGIAPDFMFNLGANYPITKNINFNVSGNYISERNRSAARQWELDPETWRTTGNIIPLDSRDAIPHRMLLNSSVLIHNLGFAKGFELQLSGYNLTNTANFNQALLVRGADLQREGISFQAKIRYHF